MTTASRNPSFKPTSIDRQMSNEFGRCARRFELQADAYTRGLHTALFIQRFKQGLFGRA
jgi:hypothetical protein